MENQTISSKDGNFHQVEFTKQDAIELDRKEKDAWKAFVKMQRSGNGSEGIRLFLEWSKINEEAGRKLGEYPELFVDILLFGPVDENAE
jgi:hypothetical protein